MQSKKGGKKRLKREYKNSCSRRRSSHEKLTQYFGSYCETGKKREKRWENAIFQRSLLPTRFMLELQKLLIKYSNKGVRLLLLSFNGSFPSFITCSSLQGNCDFGLGASSVRDASSIKCITVYYCLTKISTWSAVNFHAYFDRLPSTFLFQYLLVQNPPFGRALRRALGFVSARIETSSS